MPPREIATESEAAACFPLMRQLRPHLADAATFVARWQAQTQEGYHLLALDQAGQPVALAGYRLQQNLVHGRFLYVDDLVTDSECRSQGHGARLIQHLAGEARRLGCARLVLDTPLTNVLGHRFYYRQGLLATALRFNLAVGEAA